tara:strand:- start:1125 stop:2171 length:1047 start_codon:yes stop_codon:yes gene_type:complete
MLSENNHVLILKNDAVGDLCQSLTAINNIIETNKDKKILIYLSERSEKFNFLIKGTNIIFKKLNYDLSFIEKFKLIYFLYTSKISDIYILTPKNFYYYLPYIFRNIKFHALCINGPKNYKRPNEYLRKFLYKYLVNDRGAIYKRDHTSEIQNKLTIKNNLHSRKKICIDGSEYLKSHLPNNYIYFHIKKSITDKLSWDISALKLLFDELLKYYDYVVITKDIEKDQQLNNINNKFNVVDFNTKQASYKNINSKIILFDNIEGQDLYYTIRNSTKILAFHGMMTNLGAIEYKKVIDLWFCDINNFNDYRNYRNAFYEFKPVYKGYDFTIPSKDILKTIKKITYSLKKDA